MIIHDKMVEVIRNALVDYESATGLECQIRYADRLSAVVEVVLELAESVPADPFVAVNASQESVRCSKAASPLDLDESVEEMTDEPNMHQRIIQMHEDGKSVAEIAREVGVSRPTVYKHLDFKRQQEAK
jgi:DNA-binding NarL/FixJ family response regulator